MIDIQEDERNVNNETVLKILNNFDDFKEQPKHVHSNKKLKDLNLKEQRRKEQFDLEQKHLLEETELNRHLKQR